MAISDVAFLAVRFCSCTIRDTLIQGSCGSWKVESPWKQTWSLKVLKSVSEGPWKCLN